MNELTVIHVVPDKVQGEVSALYSVPGTHVLFIGPRECARHNCRMHYQLGRISWLCPTDTELAMGRLESMVLDSVENLIERYNQEHKELFGVVLYTGCQTEFLNVDFDYLLRIIRTRFHIAAAHHSISRFQRFDRMRLTERDIYADVFHLLEPVDSDKLRVPADLSSRGIQVLSRPVPMDASDDFRSIAESAGLGWSRNTGEWNSAEDFLRCRNSVLNIVTAKERMPAARYLESAFGTPWIFLPDSRRLKVVDDHYRDLQKKLREVTGYDISGITGELRETSLYGIDKALNAARGHVLSLDMQRAAQPWDTARALIEYGFSIGKIVLRSFPIPPGMKQAPGIPHPPGMRGSREEEDRSWVLQQIPGLQIENRPFQGRFLGGGACIHGLPNHLKPDQTVKDSGFFFPARPVPGGPGGGAAESAFWGYSGIDMLMKQIQEALSG